MPADLELREDGSAALALGDLKPAWHGLGDVVGELSLDEVWNLVPELAAPVEQRPVWAEFNGETRKLEDRMANVRTATSKTLADGTTIQIPETYVGDVGADRYKVVQNAQAFELVRAVQEYNPDVKITSAGALREGRQTFMMAHLGDDYLIQGDEQERRSKYIAFVNSYDGTLSLQLVRSNVRIVCSNTLAAALSRGRTARFRHTGDLEAKLSDARTQLGLAEVHARLEALAAEHLADTSITDGQVERWLNDLAPAQGPDGKPKEGRAKTEAAKVRDAIAAAYHQHPTVGDKKGTAWGFVNAVTLYTNHGQQRRDTKRSTAMENRFNLVIDGDPLGAKARELAQPKDLADKLRQAEPGFRSQVLAAV